MLEGATLPPIGGSVACGKPWVSHTGVGVMRKVPFEKIVHSRAQRGKYIKIGYNKTMPEKFPSPEFSSEEEALIAKLREHGMDEETQKELIAWTEKQEAKANETNTPRANIELNVKRAKLYFAAGLKAEAWDILESVRIQAMNENENTLYVEAMKIMDEIDAESQ